jgi:transcriptional regulator with XRE-family HTH domain
MNQIEQEGRALELAIAKRIRKHRRQNKWTLEELAKLTGLSKGYLSQIENGEKVPPICTLTKIAFALGTNVITLISGNSKGQESGKISMGKVENRLPIHHIESSPKTAYESFGFKKKDRIMDTYVVTMGPEFPPKGLMHGGQEFVYALEGRHEFYYDGQTYILNPGDAIYFDSNRPHMGRSLGQETAKILVVFCNSPKTE